MLKQVIVKQQDRKDCGVCCIQSILKYYNGYATLEKIRTDTFTTKRGTSAFHIIEALKKYGFDSYGTKVKKENFKKNLFPLPAIVHVVLNNGLNHYMVLYEIREDKVILMDPSQGKKTMSFTDFFWIWSEIIILAYPKQKISCYGKEKNKLSMMISLLGREKRKFLPGYSFRPFRSQAGLGHRFQHGIRGRLLRYPDQNTPRLCRHHHRIKILRKQRPGNQMPRSAPADRRQRLCGTAGRR